MFGNPLISNNPVDDIYSSQADLQGNAFSNPMNFANQGQGWNIDPSLLSPSYSAPYRPRYNGPNGANSFGHPGFFGGLNNLNPMGRDTNWGNPIMHQQSSIEDVSNRPADAGMWAFQRVAMPVMGFGLANRLTGALGIGWKSGARFGSGLGGGMAGAFGFGSPGIRAAGTAISSGFSAGGFGGAASAMAGIGVRGAVGLGARGAMAAGFGVAAGVGIPLAVGQGIISMGEKGITDPYINTRASAQDLRNNFSGITFSDMRGNAVTGKGFSFSESNNMAKHITNQGIDDMSFSTDEYRQGADMIGRTGLLDNANGGQIVQRIKDNMKQVKLIMSIASMPEMKDAVEQLAKLQMGGASTSGGLMSTASMTMGNMGRYAAMAGTSVQRMMNTTGAQGQYLYQMNGMTPYLGQMAAGASYSSLAAANRMGLISPEQMARMGGMDGATQASLTGQINAGQTLYNKMALFNTYLGGQAGGKAGFGSNQNAMNVVQSFSHSMANDPLGSYGAMTIYGRQMLGKQLEERGSLAVEDEVISRAKSFSPQLLDKNGKLSAERAVPYLMQMGMNEDQIQAYFAQRMGETDQGTYEARMKAMKANGAERVRQYISDTGTYGGTIGGGIYTAKKYGRGLAKSLKSMTVDPLLGLTGSLGDGVQSATDWAWFGATIANGDDSIENILGKGSNTNVKNLFKIDDNVDLLGLSGDRLKSRKARSAAQDINELIQGNKPGAKLAADYMNATDQAKRRLALGKLLKSGNLKKNWTNNYAEDFNDPTEFAALDNNLQSRGKMKTDITLYNNDKGFSDELVKVDGLLVNDKFETLQDIGNAVNLATDKNLDASNADDMMSSNKTLQRFAQRRRIKGGAEALAEAQKVAINARERGIDSLATVSSQLDSKNYKTSDDALKDAYNINGGAHINGTLNANKVSKEEALGLSAEVRQDALEKLKLYQLNKEGRLDFTTMRQAIGQIDMGRSIDKFGKAVDKFVNGVGTAPAKEDNGGFFRPRNLFGNPDPAPSNQNVVK